MFMSKRLPKDLTEIDNGEFPTEFNHKDVKVTRAWVSRKYLVQQWERDDSDVIRLSVCRVRRNGRGGWDDGLSWDELQQIKADVGYSDWYGVEVYPRDADVVNVANFRHIWLLESPLEIGWFKDSSS
jgi:hypothetical protein